MKKRHNQNLIDIKISFVISGFVLDKYLLTIYKILTTWVTKITYIKNITIRLELPQSLNNIEKRLNELTANGGSPI